MKVTEVRLLPARDAKDALIYFGSFVVDGQIFIGNVAVRLRPDGRSIRLTFPTKTLPSGVTLSCVHPITREANAAMTKAVAEKMRELAQKCGDRRSEPDSVLETRNIHTASE